MNKKRRDIKKAREQEEAAAKASRTLTIPRDGLTEDEAAALGTRARVVEEYRHNGFKHELGTQDVPEWFPDVAECRERCTWGASLLTNHFGSDKPLLVCLNREHFAAKMARGLEAFKAQLAETVARSDAEALVEGVIRRVRRGPAPPGVDKKTGEIKDGGDKGHGSEGTAGE